MPLEARGVIAPPQSSLKKRRVLADLSITVPFILVYLVNLFHHTLFFDEINAWTIAATSPDLTSLFQLVHYEGHPWLWYFLLWLPSRFSVDPRMMLWVVGPVGVSTYLVLGLLSPFTRLQKVLLFLSYFVAFEYTVMNRMYCVIFLLALLYAWHRCRRPEAILLNTVPLAIMASLDMAGVLLSCALLLEYLFASWQTQRNPARVTLTYPRTAAAIALYLLFLLFSLNTLMPSPNISWQSSGHIGGAAISLKRIARSTVDVVAGPWWPISPAFPHRFWETDFKDQKLLVLLVPLVLFAQWRILRTHKQLLLLVAFITALAILFADVIYIGRVRHWGITYIALLISLWMMSSSTKTASGRSAQQWPWTAYALLTLSAVAGTLATVSSWTHPFSRAREAAQWIRANHLDGPTLVGAPDVSFTSVAEELQRPVYFLECACVDRIKLFSRGRENFPEVELSGRLALAKENLHTNALYFVFYRLLDDADIGRLASKSLYPVLLKRFDGADVLTENYFIYRIQETPPTTGQSALATLR